VLIIVVAVLVIIGSQRDTGLHVQLLTAFLPRTRDRGLCDEEAARDDRR